MTLSSNTIKGKSFVLPVIVLAQLAGTSLWFAGNAVLPDLQSELYLSDNSLGYISASVQLGFIIGALIFAFLTIADRYSPSKVFLISAAVGAAFNTAVAVFASGLWDILILRFLTGFFLAGIYPVGMKISSDWYEHGLGKALGYLVGALVIGTASPHLLRNLVGNLGWENVMYFTSVVALSGGLLIYFLVPDGPYRKKIQRPDLNTLFRVFKSKKFRSAAFGYFGHMWELYTFWVFVPIFLAKYFETDISAPIISLWTFLIIAVGGLSCVAGGHISLKKGSDQVAFAALFISGICCVIFPLFFYLPVYIFLLCMLIWGAAVVADSPQFSTLVASTAPKENIGTALTVVNSIGFFITTLSIIFISYLYFLENNLLILMLMAPGPIFGLISISRLLKK